MAENSKIEWTDHTFNPWIGCTKISPEGCKNCYAEALVQRFGDDFAVRRRTSAANWKLPLKWNARAAREGRRYRVFCASLADVFDNEAPVQWRRDLFDLIEATPHLDWQLLTKRIGNARRLYGDAYLDSARPWPANVWLGATVVNQAEADRDIPKLLAVPARVRFLSIEPMVGPINLMWPETLWPNGPARCCSGHECGCQGQPIDPWLFYGIDWVIVGGESGRGQDIRPMHPQWVRDLRDQCDTAGVKFLFKQWGEWREPLDGERFDTSMGGAAKPPAFIVSKNNGTVHCFHSSYIVDGKAVIRVGKKVAGRLLDGRTHDGFPAVS